MHFQDQISLKARKTRFYQFSCASRWIFGDLGFRLIFGRNFTWTSVKTCYSPWIFDLTNGENWSRGVNRSIFKFKRAPKQEKPYFIRFSCAIFHGFLVIQDSSLFLLNFFMDAR
ncbi:hypothetical protein H5410_035128 [Solanum commersonii]|uniref:Uncharacterized protein n=1 Tax=Solanum commersonii TaxID=4109 RepID=A0A9J5Y2W9_SOLCO|nr:hypothetical protein H5410_035128 [Solanum commersonii]